MKNQKLSKNKRQDSPKVYMMHMKNFNGPRLAKAAYTLVTLGLGGLGAYAAYNSLYNVEGGQRAIVFNRAFGILDKVYPEGTHFAIPWIERPIIGTYVC